MSISVVWKIQRLFLADLYMYCRIILFRQRMHCPIICTVDVTSWGIATWPKSGTDALLSGTVLALLLSKHVKYFESKISWELDNILWKTSEKLLTWRYLYFSNNSTFGIEENVDRLSDVITTWKNLVTDGKLEICDINCHLSFAWLENQVMGRFHGFSEKTQAKILQVDEIFAKHYKNFETRFHDRKNICSNITVSALSSELMRILKIR